MKCVRRVDVKNPVNRFNISVTVVPTAAVES
jgi:hypothetical protein